VAEEPQTSVAPVSDHRPVPRGVLPRGFQTWLMAGLAFGILVIILLTGQAEPPANRAQTQTPPLAPNPERLRDYQERIRAMEARQAQEAQAPAPAAPEAPRFEEPPPQRRKIRSRRISSAGSTKACSPATWC
jgi:hypothetical protein